MPESYLGLERTEARQLANKFFQYLFDRDLDINASKNLIPPQLLARIKYYFITAADLFAENLHQELIQNKNIPSQEKAKYFLLTIDKLLEISLIGEPDLDLKLKMIFDKLLPKVHTITSGDTIIDSAFSQRLYQQIIDSQEGLNTNEMVYILRTKPSLITGIIYMQTQNYSVA